MLRCSSLLVVSLLLATSLTSAEPTLVSDAKASELRARFETRQRETRTWSAAFTQTLAVRGIARPVVSEGTIRYRAPEQLRIDFAKPAGEFVLVAGDRLFLQKPGKPLAEKSLRKDSAGKPILSLLGMLQGRPLEEDAFDIAVSRADGNYLIVLTRKANAGGRVPRRITNTVSAGTLEIRKTHVELPTGGTLTYAFDETARNEPLAAALFAAPSAGR